MMIKGPTKLKLGKGDRSGFPRLPQEAKHYWGASAASTTSGSAASAASEEATSK